jgi:SAM-dependent methyltransferase
MSRKRKIQDHYEWRISPHRQNFEILDWASPASQQARFKVLAEKVDLPGKSILDVGCGLGDLWAYLKARKIDVRYTGVDILDKMVQAARDRHPDASFVQADLFVSNPFGQTSFDVVFSSGIFNLSLGNNLEFLKIAAGELLQIARCHLVFNLLHIRSRTADKTYFHYDPPQVRSLLADLDCAIEIVDGYLPNDFTVICTKGHPSFRDS